jgi:hypothetical protein
MSGPPGGLSFTAPEWNSFGLELLGGRPLSQAFTAVRAGAVDAIVILAARNVNFVSALRGLLLRSSVPGSLAIISLSFDQKSRGPEAWFGIAFPQIT